MHGHGTIGSCTSTRLVNIGCEQRSTKNKDQVFKSLPDRRNNTLLTNGKQINSLCTHPLPGKGQGHRANVHLAEKLISIIKFIPNNFRVNAIVIQAYKCASLLYTLHVHGDITQKNIAPGNFVLK